ncbi:flagellar protein FliT [Psychrobacillus sp. PGGUH221]|uniref:flagellar protein FliT n=1 Tax=Psychrobacillus sp. PGGUH221 TaxID=3020058 RepID=UPI0035C67235
MGEVENFLAASEKLYAHLAKNPSENERTEFIEQVNELLDARGEAIHALAETDLSTNSLYTHLVELDRGINDRLQKIMDAVKGDLKDLQQKKRHEGSYSNPYAATQTIDGMYFDNKK